MASKKPSKTRKVITTVIVLAILAGAVIGGGIYIRRLGETHFNSNPSANGNTPGNLYNRGLYAETDEKVYFSNPLDHGCLYEMNKEQTEARKLSAETVYSLNAYGNYIYYSKNNLNDSNSTSILRGSVLGAARCDLDGGGIVTLNDKYTGTLVLVGNDVYFESYTNDKKTDSTSCTIRKISIEGGDSDKYSEQALSLACTVGSTLYYIGTEGNHNIYSMNLKTKSPSLLVEGNCWMPIVTKKGELYYMDLSSNYCLVKSSISHPEEKEVLVHERISSYNVSDTYIYFQLDDGSNSKLCRIRKDASANEYEVVREGNYENINVTSRYVYFNDLGNTSMTYRTSTDGPVHIQLLSDAVTFKKE